MKKIFIYLKKKYNSDDLTTRYSFRYLILLIALVLVFIIVPIKKTIPTAPSQFNSTIYSSNGTPLTMLTFNNIENDVPLLQLDSATLNIFHYLLLREDPNFMQQRTIISKFWQNYMGISARNFSPFSSGGGSTINQQLLKNLSSNFTFILNGHQRSFNSKIGEIAGAYKLAQNFTPTQILQLYINQIHFLRASNKGVLLEALKTFEVNSIRDLNELECYLLARSTTGVINNGLDFRKVSLMNIDSLKSLLSTSFTNSLIKNNKATNDDLLRIMAFPIRFRKSAISLVNPYLNQITSLVPNNTKDYQYLTSLDQVFINAIDKSFKDYARENTNLLYKKGYILDANAVILDMKNGEIMGVNSIPLYTPKKGEQGVKNRLYQKFPIASLIKALLIAIGIEEKLLQENSMLLDAKRGSLSNYHEKYKGLISLYDVLKYSPNTPLDNFSNKDILIQILEEKFQNIFGKNLRQLPKNYGKSQYVIGQPRELSIIEIVNLYKAILSNGNFYNNNIFKYCLNTSSFPYDTVFKPQLSNISLVSNNTATSMKRLLGGAITKGGTLYEATKDLEQGKVLYGKTGTSSGFLDGWCIAGNDKYLVAVHISYSKFNTKDKLNQAVPTKTGGGSAGVIAAKILNNL